MAADTSYLHQGPVIVDRYDVDERLVSLGLTRDFVTKCAFRGDLERRSTPPFGFDGHDEYVANSWIRSAMCEYGGETDGGWHQGFHHGIPVAFNHSETIAINPTTGSEGTGQPDGLPYNRSIKGPSSRRAADESASAVPLFDPDDVGQIPIDFWWFLTRGDVEELWVELFAPVFDRGGRATGWAERVILGNLGRDDGTRSRSLPAPLPAPEITIARRSS